MKAVPWLLLVLALDGWRQGAASAQPQPAERGAARTVRRAHLTATIHWQQVPLRDAVQRLESLFSETVFLDRRVDPTQRVSLEVEASSVEDVLRPLAAARRLGAGRLGPLTYLGPRAAAEKLVAVARMRGEEAARLSGNQQTVFERKQVRVWPRATEPRRLIVSLLQEAEWRVADAERIPHDLWGAGALPEMTLAEQLSVLLIGFDLTFEIRPRERVVAIVPLGNAPAVPVANLVPTPPPRAQPAVRETKQVYTLRVVEQPVGAVLRELARRLELSIDVDAAAIRAAGLSLDRRVSFAVQNVERDELLAALLRPAGLGFRDEDGRIKVVPRRPLEGYR